MACTSEEQPFLMIQLGQEKARGCLPESFPDANRGLVNRQPCDPPHDIIDELRCLSSAGSWIWATQEFSRLIALAVDVGEFLVGQCHEIPYNA